MNTIRQKLIAFNSCSYVRQLENLHLQRPVLKVVGVDRREVRHSRFLCWLFSNNELNTESAESTVMHLLDAYVSRFDSQFAVQNKKFPITIKQELLDKIEARSLIAKNMKVSSEYPTTGMTYETDSKKKTGSIDLIIRGEFVEYNHDETIPFSVVIENKVDSDEHDEQTMKYFCYMTGDTNNGKAKFTKEPENPSEKSSPKKKKKKEEFYQCPLIENEVVFFIYLSPRTEYEMKDMNVEISCKDHYIHISYQDIMDYIIVPVLDRKDLTDITKDNIEQYVLCLGTTSALDDIENENNLKVDTNTKAKATNVMAITNEHKQLAKKVWMKHKELIVNALEAKRRIVWEEPESGDEILAAFWDQHFSFLSTLLSVIAGYHSAKDIRKTVKKYYERSLESKPKCFLNGVITDISKVAVEFAKEYIKYYEGIAGYPNTAKELSQQVLKDCDKYQCERLPIELFTPPKDNKSTETLTFKGDQQVRFNKGCWYTGKSGPQFDRLLSFINILNKNSIINMNVEKA